MELSSKFYEKYFRGYHLTGCVVRSKKYFYYVLIEGYDESKSPPPDHERTTRVIGHFRDGRDRPWGSTELIKFNTLLAGASEHPLSQFVGVDGIGQVYVLGSGVDEIEQIIPPGYEGGPARGGTRSLKMVEGYLYGCCGNRSLFKRVGRNEWVSIGGNPPEATEAEQDAYMVGFDDFDAFSSDDIYCAGDRGDVWHWNGQAWRRIEVPTNMYMHSVCCGGDGYVYIGMQSGNVLRGREDRWELFHEDQLALPFKDMVWFADTLWATNDYGLWQLTDGKIDRAEVPIEISNCAGNLSVADGVMLLAGEFGAALHDGTEWKLLFDLATLSVQNRKTA